jgi:plasmid replication initiation protein
MIEVSKNYKITLDEHQARLLYDILDLTDKDRRYGLNVLYNELKNTLKIGIR